MRGQYVKKLWNAFYGAVTGVGWNPGAALRSILVLLSTTQQQKVMH